MRHAAAGKQTLPLAGQAEQAGLGAAAVAAASQAGGEAQRAAGIVADLWRGGAESMVRGTGWGGEEEASQMVIPQPAGLPCVRRTRLHG